MSGRGGVFVSLSGVLYFLIPCEVADKIAFFGQQHSEVWHILVEVYTALKVHKSQVHTNIMRLLCTMYI